MKMVTGNGIEKKRGENDHFSQGTMEWWSSRQNLTKWARRDPLKRYARGLSRIQSGRVVGTNVSRGAIVPARSTRAM